MRKENMLKTVAMFMTVLVLMLPVSFAQSMNQTTPQGAITLNAVVPTFSKIKYIDVQGTTAPDAKLEYYIGPTKVKVSRSRSDGSFLTTRVPLTKTGENTLLIKAIVGDKSVQKSFQVFFDSNPPVLTISDIPSFTTQPSINVRGDISEPVTIKYGSYSKQDDDAPSIVSGLEVREVQKNQVTLAWTPSTEEDFLEYAIYRDGKRVGVARTAVFLDNAVASGKEYTYQVSAVDTSCNEGPKSASKKAKTKSGGNDVESEASAVSLSCDTKFSTLNTAVPFDITLSLTAGRNIVEIIAEDKAGNVDKITKEVTLDQGPPQILSTNIDSIGTTYIPDIDIKGQLSEKGTVFVYVNDMSKPMHYGLTDDEGNFEIPVKLKSEVKVESGAAAELDTGVGWENKIRIKAVDLAGQETWYPSASKTSTVIWAICGYGSWFDFDVEQVTPPILTPRLMMQGIQQIGVPFTLTYIGGQQDAELAGLVNAVPVRLSPDVAEYYDNEKVSSPQVWIQKRADSKTWDGYIQVNFAEWPVDQLDLGVNKTDAAVEKAISDWRKGEYPEVGWGGRGVYLQPGCIDPALGCVKLYLELDIPLKEKVRIFDPKTQQERFEWKTSRQRNCLPITLSIDQVIPPDVIRKKSLEATSNFFGDAIELIDKVLDPLTTFTENLMYLCMSSAAAIFLAGITKKILCSNLILKKGVDSDVAQAGVCELAYDHNEDLKTSCERCQWAAKTYKNIVEDLYRPICDRLTCPSAPTVQKFILDKKKTPKDITSKLPSETKDKVLNEWGVNGKLYSGSGCGLTDQLSTGYTVGTPAIPLLELPPNVIEQERQQREIEQRQWETQDESLSVQVAAPESSLPSSIDTSSSFMTGAVTGVASAFATGSAVAAADNTAKPVTTSSTSLPPAAKQVCGFDLWTEFGLGSGQVGVKELYQIYKGEGNYAKIKEKCTNSSLHPACPLCCGIDYMWEWNSACGIGNFLGTTKVVDLDTYDELKHSAQLAAEKAGRGDDFGTPNILNFLSGFCTSEGNPTPDVIRTGLNFNPKISEAEENAMQVFVFPDSTATGDNFKYKVFRGYLAKTFVVENAIKKEDKKIKASDRYKFSSTIEAIKDTELTQFFSKSGNEETKKKGFAAALCKNVGKSKLEGKKSCSKVAEEVYAKVKSHVSTSDQEYIIKPTSGIINSIRCICFPSLIAYLKQWRAISVAIKNCIDMIRLTGDGSEGQCRSLLSTYVCDLLWEVVSCFVNKWSSPGGKRLGADAGIGSIIGILTGAGSDLANEVKGRYGETATFNAMFNEKEVVHGLCLLAFGLEWNVDVSAMVQQSVESIPVETTVLGPTPCQSRFIAWNPITNPRGLTTWEYHFGVMAAAGADLTARVKLKCSEGFECSETDGFTGGECDCNKGGAQEITITPTCKPSWKSQIKKDELVSLDCTYLAQQTKHRFDTLTFEYDWYDTGTKKRVTKSSDCKINMVGSAPPAFCRFDPLTASFRCRYGESPSGLQIETIKPQYACTYKNSDTSKTEVFAVDEDPRFELLVTQMMPEDVSEMDQGIKFLGYKITDSKGEVVTELDPNKDRFNTQLKTDGQYKQNAEILNDGSWKEHFAKGQSLKPPVTVWTSDTGLTSKINSNPVAFVDDVSLRYTVKGQQTVPAKKFVVDIQNNKLKVYEFHGKTAGYLTNDKYKVFEGTVKTGQSYQVVHPVQDGQYTISFKIKSTQFFDDNQVQYLIEFKQTGATKDPCETGVPVTWNVEFTAYDADKYGRITSQVSVDPKTGEKQSKSMPFKISCFEKKSLVCEGVPEVSKTAEVLHPAFSSITLGGITVTEGMSVLPIVQPLRITTTVEGDVRVSARKGTIIESRFLPEDSKNIFLDDYILLLTKFEGQTDFIVEVVDKADPDKVIAKADYTINIASNKIKSVEIIPELGAAMNLNAPRAVGGGKYQLKVTTTEEAGKVELYLIKPGLEITTIVLQKTGENTYTNYLELIGGVGKLNYYGSTVMFYSKTGQHVSDVPNEIISVSGTTPIEAQRASCAKFKAALNIGTSFAIAYDDHWPFKDRADIEATCGIKLPVDVILEPDSATCDNIKRIDKCQEYVTRMKKSSRYIEADIEYACGTNLCKSKTQCYYDKDKKDCIPRPAILQVTAPDKELEIQVYMDPLAKTINLPNQDYFDHYDPVKGGSVWTHLYSSEDNDNKPSEGEIGVLRLRIENKGTKDYPDIRGELVGPPNIQIQYYDSSKKELLGPVSPPFDLTVVGPKREKVLPFLIHIPEDYISTQFGPLQPIRFTLKIPDLQLVGEAPAVYTASGENCRTIDACSEYNQQDCNEDICGVGGAEGCIYDAIHSECKSAEGTSTASLPLWCSDIEECSDYTSHGSGSCYADYCEIGLRCRWTGYPDYVCADAS